MDRVSKLRARLVGGLIGAAIVALGLITTAFVVLNREPVDHSQCPAPFDPDYRDCDWWPKRNP